MGFSNFRLIFIIFCDSPPFHYLSSLTVPHFASDMDAVNELQHLEAFLVDEHERDKKKIENFYECVQYAGAIVPRL